jgi:hypothetical protein
MLMINSPSLISVLSSYSGDTCSELYFALDFAALPLPLTDTTQSRGGNHVGSGKLSCDPELLTECLIFIAT